MGFSRSTSRTDAMAQLGNFIVGSLGNLLGAPVPETKLIFLTHEFIAENPRCAELGAGYAHGSKHIPDVRDSARIVCDSDENRERFAMLSVLYGWMDAKDRQYLYGEEFPNLVWSHNHGWFFPGGASWNVLTLFEAAPAEPDHNIRMQVELTPQEIDVALGKLGDISDQAIVDVVCTVPEQWNILDAERVGLVRFLTTRRDMLLDTKRKGG